MQDLKTQKKQAFENSNYPKLQGLSNRIQLEINGAPLTLMKTDYSIQDIEKFYKDNKKVLFKKGEKQKEELRNNWTEDKFIQILDSIVIYADKKGKEGILEKLNNIFADFNFTNEIKMYGDNDSDYSLANKKLDDDKIKLEKDLMQLSMKDFFYKYILPNAILNDGKGQTYIGDESKYVADLRFKTSELSNLLGQFSDYQAMEVRTQSINECLYHRKRSLELGYIILYLSNLDLTQEIREAIEKGMKDRLGAEKSFGVDKDYGSIFKALYGMINLKDDLKIDFESPLTIFYYIKYIIPSLKLLGEIIGDKDLKKIKS